MKEKEIMALRYDIQKALMSLGDALGYLEQAENRAKKRPFPPIEAERFADLAKLVKFMREALHGYYDKLTKTLEEPKVNKSMVFSYKLMVNALRHIERKKKRGGKEVWKLTFKELKDGEWHEID